MSLEEQIVSWAGTRPDWQRAILRMVADGQVFSNTDYDKIVDGLIKGTNIGDSTFGLEQLPDVKTGDPPVLLSSIEKPEHVNALSSEHPLTFDETGLTIVYGDNASGKSGYARLLKRISRARHQEEILSDVFSDTALVKPTAKLKIKIGTSERSLDWPRETTPELQRMLFYDQACGSQYTSVESDFLYRPSALFVLDGLIHACIEVRKRIDEKLNENQRGATTLPDVDQDVVASEIGLFLSTLSADSSIETLDVLLGKTDTSNEAIDELKRQESSLHNSDITKEKQTLVRQLAKLEFVKQHIEGLQQSLSDEAIRAIQRLRDKAKNLESDAEVLGKSFESEPVVGVGTEPWRELWEAARRFSLMVAYPSETFPLTTPSAKCVLCHQALQPEAADRLVRFEKFIQEDLQKQLQEARKTLEISVARVTNLVTTTETVDSNLKDLELRYNRLTDDVRESLSKYEEVRAALASALSIPDPLPFSGSNADEIIAKLDAASREARTTADNLSNSKTLEAQLRALTMKRKERELLRAANDQRDILIKEISRLKERQSLENVKAAAATGPLTNKILEFSENNITEMVRDTFTREADRLYLERVTIAKTRAEKGILLHQPKLVGARQNVTLPRVFSEGEKTALGLAAFLTEAHLDASKSALILDDPVTSLDHSRRGFVAGRLAKLATDRQVIIFTHDVAFVADLKREAKGLAVEVAERSVSRGRGAQGKPGACGTKHPWKAKDVPERINQLREELARIKKECEAWDDTTYENQVATWAGNLSETWERIFSQEIVGTILAEGGLEVRPNMVKLLSRFSEIDEAEFQASYSRVSQWAKRHDKNTLVNYVAPSVDILQQELELVINWFKRVKKYKD